MKEQPTFAREVATLPEQRLLSYADAVDVARELRESVCRQAAQKAATRLAHMDAVQTKFHIVEGRYEFSVDLAVCSAERMRELLQTEENAEQNQLHNLRLTDENRMLQRKLNKANDRLQALSYAFTGD